MNEWMNVSGQPRSSAMFCAGDLCDVSFTSWLWELDCDWFLDRKIVEVSGRTGRDPEVAQAFLQYSSNYSSGIEDNEV